MVQDESVLNITNNGISSAQPEAATSPPETPILGNDAPDARERQVEVRREDGPEPEVIEDDEDLLADYPPDTTELDLIHLRISSIPSLHITAERFPNLQKLCLRQNRILDIEALEPVAETLEELDLYDNAISHIHGLEKLTKLTSLDLSFNNIKHVKRLDTLKQLKDLFFVQNRISRIEGLQELAKLRNLELGANRIREIENLETLTNLEELWLGKNKITELKGLDTLSNLRILSIQSNRLTKIEGLENLVALEELYISHNALSEISGLEKNTKLRVLDVSSNRIAHLTNLADTTPNLEELWASSNLLESFEEIERELGKKESLETVYFEGNPLQKAAGPTYRNKIRLALKDVKQIDATMVRA